MKKITKKNTGKKTPLHSLRLRPQAFMIDSPKNRTIKIEINGKFNAIFLKSKIKKRFIKLIFTQKNNGEIDGLRLHNFKSEYGYKRGKFKVIYPEMNENHN